MPIKAVVFDLDDTLYPEKDYVMSGFSAVAEYAQAALKIERAKRILPLHKEVFISRLHALGNQGAFNVAAINKIIFKVPVSL